MLIAWLLKYDVRIVGAIEEKMVRPRSMSVLLGCTITNWNALITTVYVRQIHCQYAQMFLSLFHSTGRYEPPPVSTYIYTGCHTDWVWTVVTTISCRLCQSNGSLTCPIAGAVTAGVHNEGVDISIPLRWMTKMTRMTRNLKSRPWEWLAEGYGKLVIVVILVMEKLRVDKCLIMHNMYFYEAWSWNKSNQKT